MRALIVDGERVRIVDVPSHAPGPGEAVVRVTRAGVCATDLEIVRGYMGFRGILGHEFCGVVESSPDPAWTGRRVVGEINCACGSCPTCRAGRPTHCPGRTVMGIQGRDGAFAERIVLPLANLHAVPDGVSDEAAVFTEPLAAACEVLEQVPIRPTDRVVVLGLGRLGQLVVRVLALTGAQVLGVGRSHLGLLPPGVGAVAADDVDGLDLADIVVECTGAPGGLAIASGLVRPRGTLVLKSTVHQPAPPPVTGWVLNEITVVGSRCGPFPPALRLLASGLVDPRPLVHAVLGLSDGAAALAEAGRPGVLKVLLDPAR